MVFKRLALLACSTAFAITIAGAQTHYTLTDLGATLNGGQSLAYDVNSSGQVVGWMQVASGDTRPFLYSGGMMQDLGSFGGHQGWAHGLNETGDIVGYSADQYNGPIAFVYHPGGSLQPIGYNFNSTSGVGINASGTIVLNDHDVHNGNPAGFILQGGTMTQIGTFGGDTSSVGGINDAGQVTGGALTASGYGHAFRYTVGTLEDLGVLPGGTSSFGNSINSSGDVVGWAELATGVSPFIYKNGTMTDLGNLGGWFGRACDINDTGVVVGASAKNANQNVRAFVNYGSGMFDLNTLIDGDHFGLTLSWAQGISQNGYIVGQADDAQGRSHAFLLTPVPEPTSLSILGLACAAFLRKRKKA